uniref:C-type lectin domain-containing protein n=1 Tax=Oncorhynchus mykiss TaxID=8022 RepID=A0A8C7RQZ4_ONCMY
MTKCENYLIYLMKTSHQPNIRLNSGEQDTNLTYVLIQENRTWIDAQSYCRQHHIDLVSVRNQTENTEMKQKISLRGLPVWIGLFQDSWRWSDQSDSSFRNGTLGHPDASGQNCVALFFESVNSAKWVKHPCDHRHNFICNSGKLQYSPLDLPDIMMT